MNHVRKYTIAALSFYPSMTKGIFALALGTSSQNTPLVMTALIERLFVVFANLKIGVVGKVIRTHA